MSWKRTIALMLITSPLILMTGCWNKFDEGVRKIIAVPGRRWRAGRKMDEAYAKSVSPVVKIQDSAGQGPEDGGEAITPELAAQYRAVAESNPQDPVARYNLGRLYLQEGALEKATYEFDLAASLDPQFTWAYILLGRALRLRGQYDLALAKLAIASRLMPELVVPYIEAGVCWDERGFYEKARQQYQAALAVSPNNPDVYNNLGYSFYLDSQYREAIKQYQKALELAPDDPYANNNLAVAYSLKGDFKRAFIHFSRALGPSTAHNNLGFMLRRAGKIAESIEHFQEAVRLDSESESALANLTAALRDVGRYEEAEQAHQQLLAVQKKLVAKAKANAGSLAK